MEVMFQSSGNVLITLLRGDIDHHTASALRHTIDQSMKEFGCSDLVMDFSGCWIYGQRRYRRCAGAV